jgi:hypothetical protein
MSEPRQAPEHNHIIDLAHQVEHGDAAGLSQFFKNMSRMEQLGYALQLKQIIDKDISNADPQTAKLMGSIKVTSSETNSGGSQGQLEISSGAEGRESLSVYHSTFDSQGNLTGESHVINQPGQQTDTPISHDRIVELTHQLEQVRGDGVEEAFKGMSFENQVKYAQEIAAVIRQDRAQNPDKNMYFVEEQDHLSTSEYPSKVELDVGGKEVYSGSFDAQGRQISESHQQ